MLVGLLLLPILVWLAVAIGVKMTMAEDVPFGALLLLVGEGLAGSLICAVGGCEAELLEGMESVAFGADLLEATPVAIEVDEFGRVYVAETARMNQGTEDNRSHAHWLMDDLASRTVDDRRAYYAKAIEEGQIADPDHFTANTDRVVVLDDTDGDGLPDRRSELAAWNDPASGLIAGVEAREGYVWVTAIPSLHRLLDENNDGVAEHSVELHTGFGVKTSLVGHDLHGLAWGPDGKLYFSMGDRGYHVELPDGRVHQPTMGPGRGAVMRMNPDGSDLEVFATGVRNPQELAFDDYGNLFTGDNNGDGGDSARLVYLVEGGETGWAMPYQTLAGDYVRGPWMAERLWDLQHATQPAWVLPPVAHIGNGPAGFLHYPGMGLPDRYRNHFFLCDYAYMPGRSGIWSFALEPRGAGMQMVDRHRFIWSFLVTDIDFAWDGRLFATAFDQVRQTQELVELRHAASLADPRLAELPGIVQEKMGAKTSEQLAALLSFPDQRVRLRSQFELAARREIGRLAALALDPSAELIPRLHAVWGLSQIGAEGLRAVAADGLGWSLQEPEELRVQLVKAAGDVGADWLAPGLRARLADPSARLRFFAAQSLGALGDRSSIDGLFELLRANADEDVFLRHAAVWALHRIADLDAVLSRRDDPSRSVRLAVLLVLRQAGDARIAHFLADEDPLIVVEAARAIYDWPIDGAMQVLASGIDRLEPVSAQDTQVGQALHRRVIGANVRLRSREGAHALARYAMDEAQLPALRRLALDALGSYSEPPVRDLTMGFYRPLEPADPEILASVFRARGRALVDSSLGSRAMEIANQIGELPLDEEELGEIAEDVSALLAARVSAVLALRSRAASGGVGEAAQRVAAQAIAADAPALRNAGRDLLFELDPAAGLASLLEAVESAAHPSERRHGWRRLGVIDDERVGDVIAKALADWEEENLETSVALEVIEAALAQGDALLVDRARSLITPSAEEPVESRRWALAGGDPEAGRVVFQTGGDCQRCHAGGGGHEAGVGPDLAGISRRGARYVLESVVAPQERVAPGFGSVVVTRSDGTVQPGLLVDADDRFVTLDVGGEGRMSIPREDVAEMTEPVTGMPPIGAMLSPRALRDVIAYVMSLQ